MRAAVECGVWEGMDGSLVINASESRRGPGAAPEALPPLLAHLEISLSRGREEEDFCLCDRVSTAMDKQREADKQKARKMKRGMNMEEKRVALSMIQGLKQGLKWDNF